MRKVCHAGAQACGGRGATRPPARDNNPRIAAPERLDGLSQKQTRVPDIMFVGSGVGINYDWGMHYDLRSIAEATTMEPNETDEALAAVRRAIVDDKRRDRDLWLRGLTVLPATSEDLYQPRGPDRLMGQVMEAIERTAGRDLSLQRSVLTRQPFVRERQRLVWSLLPGERGRRISQQLVRELQRPQGHVESCIIAL